MDDVQVAVEEVEEEGEGEVEVEGEGEGEALEQTSKDILIKNNPLSREEPLTSGA